MAATADYLNNLITQRNALADNLVTKGVVASHDELFDTLVPKVLNISGGDVPTPAVKQSPASLGYVAQNVLLFYDGIFNAGYAHDSSRASAIMWYDLAENYCISRADGNVSVDCYIKGSGDAYVFYIPKSLLLDDMKKSIFTFEIALKITSVPSTSEQVIAGDQSGEKGITIHTSGGKFSIGHGTDCYHTDIPTEKITVQMVYDGTSERIYINGELMREQAAVFSPETFYNFGIGGWGGKKYSTTKCELYRVAFYGKALTADDVLNNYSCDALRFGY